MNLKILGKYGAFSKSDGATSGYLVKAGEAEIMLDFGSGIFSRLTKFCKIETLSAIVLSHYHFDHISDIYILDYYLSHLARLKKFDGKIPLFIPFDIRSHFNFIYKLRYFEVHTMKEGLDFNIKGVNLKFYNLHHSVKCMGVKITFENKTLSYIADTKPINKINEMFKGSDLALCAANIFEAEKEENIYHMSYKDLGEYAKQNNVRTILTHINPLHDEDDILKEAKKAGGDVVIASEFCDYTI